MDSVDTRKALNERLPHEVFNRIHQDIGAASMCWSNIEGAGTFEVEKASEIAFELCHYVADLIEGV